MTASNTALDVFTVSHGFFITIRQFLGERSATATERPGLQPGQPLAPARPASSDQELVAAESAATAREDRQMAREACALLLIAIGRGQSPPAAVRRHAAEDLGATGARRIAGNCRPRTFSCKGTEQGRRGVGTMPLESGAPVGSASTRPELTGIGSWKDVRRRNLSVRRWSRCTRGPDPAGKMEIRAPG